MTAHRIRSQAWLLAILLLLPSGATATTTSERVPITEGELPAPVLEAIEVALEQYELIRAGLAADNLAEVPAGAERLANALRPTLAGRAALVEVVPSLIEDATFMAETLMRVTDLTAARETFAELSRSFLLLSTHDPRMTEGLHVFSCPMVDTFEKWIQPTEAIDNPYMGKSMPTCGSSSDWAASEAESWLTDPELTATAPGEPTFEPGTPGVKMFDVRDYKFLWREIEELQRWERRGMVTTVEFRDKVTEKTAQFLKLEDVAFDNFVAGATTAVETVRESFSRRQQPGPTHVGGADRGFSSDLSRATEQVAALLGDEARHQLFEPEIKKWLLKLSFSPREAKEEQEAREPTQL